MTTSLSFPALGTSAGLHVTDAVALEPARRALEAELQAIDLGCSRFRGDSELSRLNAGRGRLFQASELFAEAVAVALRAARMTDGAVDPTVGRALRAIGYDRDFADLSADSRKPALRVESVAGWRSIRLDRRRRLVQAPDGVELDLGATAKALAADRAAERAHRATGHGVLVNLGGDLAIAGPQPTGGWPVFVTDDHTSGIDAPGQMVTLSGGGLATSSTTVRRWATASGPAHHVVDPSTGLPAEEVWRTVSVAAASCVDANIAATAAIVRGEPASAWLEELRLPARLVRPGGAVLRVGAWPEEPA